MSRTNLIERIRYSPISVQMVITRRCNLSCGYCGEFDRTSLPVPIGRLKRQVEKLSELGTSSLTLTGGEPLLHPDIFGLIRYSKRYIFNVGVLTNGFLLTEEKILKLNSVNLDGLQISIDGANPNKTTIKVLRYLEDKLALLEKYAAFAVNINAVIGSTEANIAERTVVTNTASIVFDTNEAIATNEVWNTIGTVTDLAVTMTQSADSLQVNGPLTYTISIEIDPSDNNAVIGALATDQDS